MRTKFAIVLSLVVAAQSFFLWREHRQLDALARRVDTAADRSTAEEPSHQRPAVPALLTASTPAPAAAARVVGEEGLQRLVADAFEAQRQRERGHVLRRAVDNLTRRLGLAPEEDRRLEAILAASQREHLELREKLESGEMNRADLEQALAGVREQTQQSLRALLDEQRMNRLRDYLQQYPEFAARGLFGLARPGADGTTLAVRRAPPPSW